MGCGANTNIATKEYNKSHSIINTNIELYTDKEFPPENSSIFGGENLDKIIKSKKIKNQENFKELINDFNENKIVWKRASEIFNNQEYTLFSSDLNYNSIIQGSIGNCYFLSIICSLTKYPSFIYQLFNTSYISPDGYYEIKLKINDVIHIISLDDYFPYNLKTNMPLFCKSYKNEIWVMLLEKALAKVKGSYLEIDDGSPIDILDYFLISSLIERDILYDTYYITNDNKYDIWENIMDKINNNKKLMMICLSKENLNNKKKLSNLYYSIVEKHYYNILEIFENTEGGKDEKLLRIRNPWGFNLKNENYDSKKNEFDFIINDDNQDDKNNKNKNLLSGGDFIIDYKYFCYLFKEIQIYEMKNFSYNIIMSQKEEQIFNIIYLNIKQFKNEELIISIKPFLEDETQNLKDNENDYISLLFLTIDIKNILIINKINQKIYISKEDNNFSIIVDPHLSEEYYLCLLFSSNNSSKFINKLKFHITFENEEYFDLINNVEYIQNNEIYDKIKDEFKEYKIDLNFLKNDKKYFNHFFKEIDDINLNKTFLLKKYPKEMRLLLELKPMNDNKEEIIFRDRYYYENNNYYLGEQFYCGNIRHGRGLYYFNNTGNMYIGYNKYGNFNGKGKIIYKNGNIKKGKFINGKLMV